MTPPTSPILVSEPLSEAESNLRELARTQRDDAGAFLTMLAAADELASLRRQAWADARMIEEWKAAAIALGAKGSVERDTDRRVLAIALLVTLGYFGYCIRLIATCDGRVLLNAMEWPVCVK